jgi:hypothetical protein
MAHFAEIDSNNVVLRVLVVTDEQEHRGQEFLAVDCGLGGTWIQTSYNGNIRNKFAGVGDIYDETNDEFYAPVSDVVNVKSIVNEQQAIEGA